MSLLVVAILVSARSMDAQFEKESNKIKIQGNTLRDLLKEELTKKQTFQRQAADAAETLENLEEQIEMLREEDRILTLHLGELQIAMEEAARSTSTSLLDNSNNVPILPSPLPTPVAPVPIPQIPVDYAPKTSNINPQGGGYLDAEKRDAVKDGFLHAWNSYKTYAWGRDELNPLTNSFKTWIDLGVTIVDSLDTLWIMDLQDEFKLGRDWVAENLNFEKSRSVSFFETTIRELGGLLGAYEFSKDEIFLEKAEDLGTRLLKAFREGENIPMAAVNLMTGAANAPSWTGGSSILSEIGTVQLEFLYLSYHTGNPIFAQKALGVFEHLDSLEKEKEGLYPLYINPTTGKFRGNDYSIGALGDSFYEYMLKLWLFTDKQGEGYRRMYEESARGMEGYLVQTSPSGFRYMAQTKGPQIQYKMEHLTCFTGGMFALGAIEEASPSDKADHFQLADDLTTTCHQSYDVTKTKLGPEVFEFRGDREFVVGSAYYILRPEVIESYFVLWRTTHDQKYRDWAWEAFQAIEKHCRREVGYSGIRNVDAIPVGHDDTQQSFFLAETLKYLYLIFSDDDLVPLSDYVFNTEAHPLGKITVPLEYWNPEIAAAVMTK